MQWASAAPRRLVLMQRDDAADAGDAEPDRHVFGPVRHHQADDVALGEILRRAPSARSGWRARRAPDRSGFSRAESSAGASPRAAAQLLDHVEQQALRIAADRRGRFERAHPVAQRAVFAAGSPRAGRSASIRAMPR